MNFFCSCTSCGDDMTNTESLVSSLPDILIFFIPRTYSFAYNRRQVKSVKKVIAEE